MDAYLALTFDDQRDACRIAEARTRLPAASIEKDFWVCWTLREVFNLPGVGNHLTFKGGTSLSKAWGLIERFSEDIDIVIDKDALGFAGDASPDKAPSNKQRRRRLDDLMAACRAWVQSKLKPALEEAIAKRIGTRAGWRLEIDPDMADGQCLLFHYPSAFATTEAGYVRPVVKFELGARSDHWPANARTITPYAAEVLPQAIPDAAFTVSALLPERTFWEKAMLLHEETFRPANKPRKERMARHYYDAWCLITRGVAERAAADHALFARIAEHRQIFFRLGWVDYATLQPGTLRLMPPAAHHAAWQQDYQAMAEAMFHGNRPTFDEILHAVGDFERRFNQVAEKA